MERNGSDLDLPGFRFHPTEEELLGFYLRQVVEGKKLNFDIIGTLNLYRHDPWDLPSLAKIGEREWYFFVPRDRRQSSGGRPNRTTERGFWKATGSDRAIRSAGSGRLIGLKKTLVFYMGRAPRGSKTDWVMNEYRLPETTPSSGVPPPQEDIVLCKIYRKATSLKQLEQRAATEVAETVRASSPSSPELEFYNTSQKPSSNNFDAGGSYEIGDDFLLFAKEEEVEMKKEVEISSPLMTSSSSSSQVVRPVATALSLPEIEVPKYGGMAAWTQDPFLTQLRSPWLDQWSPLANLLNF